ncbi:hypothetical protein CLAFUW4_03230 [Fulvia fulva]|uniref:Uncharacterized protein n=1 Tax=Passalora fulva TaxID=5499 RepID=A0A9Q8P567_PASFU|nr:uncharacterized protein CLAFUR5_03213 [Fulvia fulva]UJO13576.1 hypothetical protein CLAFUR5_03213 [Fulvia fulva]WPV11882.1 hypothetical protein CLAFUW4_03230 [Fulvia fulva]
MDSPTAFQFPSRESQALHPLSPERAHNSRQISTASTMTAKSSASEAEGNENASPRGSPLRKANLFADYQPQSPTRGTGLNGLPLSPSMPEIPAFRSHARTNSDVQGLVKRFEHLDVRDRDAESNERRKKHELELRRAQIAREEAESDVKRLREEVRRLRKEGDEGRDRERKVGKRLEVVMDEFTTFKESHSSQSSVYEKEVRRSRKEAFKSSSELLKVKEDLKSLRSSFRVMQQNLEAEKRKVQQREQETFDAQYHLATVQEELDKLRTHIKVVEEEREALKTSLKEEEVARIAAEGMIALPAASQDDDEDLMSSPRRRSPQKAAGSPLSDDKENVGIVTKKMIESRRLEEELAMERTRREHAEELSEFLRMECRFGCCDCKTAKPEHSMLAISNALAKNMESIRRSMREVLAPPTSPTEKRDSAIMSEVKAEPDQEHAEPPVVIKIEQTADIEMGNAAEADVSDHAERSMTLAGDQIDDNEEAIEDDVLEVETPRAPRPTPVNIEMEQPESETGLTESTTKVPLLPSSRQTPAQPQPPTPFHQQRSARTITTTTTIPMRFTPSKPTSHDYEDAENIPPTIEILSPRSRAGSAPTFDREAALAAIAYRRGRAKSIANGHATPRKQMIEGVSIKERRDISAPALGQQKKVSANVAKGTASVGRGVAGSGRRLA